MGRLGVGPPQPVTRGTQPSANLGDRMKAVSSAGWPNHCLFISAPWWAVEAAFLPKPITGGLDAYTGGLSQLQTLRAVCRRGQAPRTEETLLSFLPLDPPTLFPAQTLGLCPRVPKEPRSGLSCWFQEGCSLGRV